MKTNYFQELVSKKDDPNYVQAKGHIPKDLAQRFDLACVKYGFDKSQGLEAAIESFLEKLESGEPIKIPPGGRPKQSRKPSNESLPEQSQ